MEKHVVANMMRFCESVLGAGHVVCEACCSSWCECAVGSELRFDIRYTHRRRRVSTAKGYSGKLCSFRLVKKIFRISTNTSPATTRKIIS